MARGILSLVDRDLTPNSAQPSYRSSGRCVVEYGANRYVFYIGLNNDLYYRKSTDRGKTWTSVTIHAATYENMAVWFDQWTPGDSGTVVHIWGIESVADDVNYFSLDLSSDTLGNSGTAIVVFNGASAFSSQSGVEISGAKARGGNLYVLFNIDAGSEMGFYRSTDSGATWSSRSDANEVAGDYYLLVPGNETDNQDMWAVYWDVSANEISLKTYDDSANSWAETSISGSMADVSTLTTAPQFAACIQPSDNHLLLAAWSERDTVTADLRTWDINGAGSITAKTDVHTNVDDCQCVALSVAPNGTVHCTYLGKGDGSETASSALTVNRKSSSDGMATWGTEYPLFDDFTLPLVTVMTALISEGYWPLPVFVTDNLTQTVDALLCAWLPGSVARSISAVGV